MSATPPAINKKRPLDDDENDKSDEKENITTTVNVKKAKKSAVEVKKPVEVESTGPIGNTAGRFCTCPDGTCTCPGGTCTCSTSPNSPPLHQADILEQPFVY